MKLQKLRAKLNERKALEIETYVENLELCYYNPRIEDLEKGIKESKREIARLKKDVRNNNITNEQIENLELMQKWTNENIYELELLKQ